MTSSPDHRQHTGRDGEEQAARYLESQGYLILARNWRSSHTRNEIDLIAREGDTIVFVEVKSARTVSFGDPLEWITPQKQSAIIRAATAYLEHAPDMPGGYRFDIVTVAPAVTSGHRAITHVRAAFTADDVIDEE
ncbi:MAG: YraN family protein [candidate division Zixibacteria bacterium]|nr:YraN family protein [candidate division Zixibacteria bacterium]